MSINITNEKNIPIDTHACYELLACQEELYLEETEEEVVAILTSYVSPTSKSDRPIVDVRAKRESGLEIEVATVVTNPRMVTNADKQLVKAIEELITGDSDDPPFSEDSVQEMLTD